MLFGLVFLKGFFGFSCGCLGLVWVWCFLVCRVVLVEVFDFLTLVLPFCFFFYLGFWLGGAGGFFFWFCVLGGVGF